MTFGACEDLIWPSYPGSATEVNSLDELSALALFEYQRCLIAVDKSRSVQLPDPTVNHCPRKTSRIR